jgi:hypothetical protein
MNDFLLTNNHLNSNPHWVNETPDVELLLNPYSVDMFDQNGYQLTPVEQSYAVTNGMDIITRRHEKVIRNPWFISNKRNGVHINHSDLFERKSYSGQAFEQIYFYAKKNPMLYKLTNLKSKWGIDISLDYVSEDKCFEVFHYEWDSFNHDDVYEKKCEIENFVLNQDWEFIAEVFWSKRDEWLHLDFFGQSDWRTNYLGLSPEKFKNVVWNE